MSPTNADALPDLAVRVVELETRVAFQDQTIQELNGAVIRQQREIDRLTRELKTLRERLRALAPSPVVPPDEETPPPHY
jgi:SlyX protein